jgi:hypothetical protein
MEPTYKTLIHVKSFQYLTPEREQLLAEEIRAALTGDGIFVTCAHTNVEISIHHVPCGDVDVEVSS